MNRASKRIGIVVAVVGLLLASRSAADGAGRQDACSAHPLTPVILFPGWGATRLEVSVHGQSVAPECASSGVFEHTFFPPPSVEFSQVCKDKLLTLVHHLARGPAGDTAPPRVSEQPGVHVGVADYGKTESAPFYAPLFAFLEQAGYQRNVNLKVAGYDFRLTPNMGGFMRRTTALIRKTYHDNCNTPVHLVGHSNGPLYAQYLLRHTSRHWRNKYIHGFTPIAGNWPGQGALYTYLFTGFNVPTAGYPTDPVNAASSAAMYESHPSTYMSASDPAYFGKREVVIRIGAAGKAYTPLDYRQLFEDAGLKLAQKIAPYYFGIVKFRPPSFPNVDVYAEKGSGLPTPVGTQLPDLTVGQVLPNAPVLITRDGDSDQEDITNDAVVAWRAMPCYRFEFNDNPGVNHVILPFVAPVEQRLLMHVQQPRSQCARE